MNLCKDKLLHVGSGKVCVRNLVALHTKKVEYIGHMRGVPSKEGCRVLNIEAQDLCTRSFLSLEINLIICNM